MARVSILWKQRILLILVGVSSLGGLVLHRVLWQAHIYDIRWAGGLHPSDILQLHWAGQLVAYLPAVIVVALFLSFARPSTTGALLVVCTAVALVLQLLFLLCMVMVILLNVPAPKA